MKPQDKLKQLMAKLVELPPTDDKLDLAIDFCSNGEFPTAQSVSDAIIADIQLASSPTKFLWDSCNIDLENEDVGSIVGYDASGGPVLDKYDIVPEGDVSELVVPPSTEVINGLTVTYPPYSSLNPSGQFIMKCMSKWWLKGAFDLVEQAYGLKFDENSFVTTMPIQLDDVPPSGGAIIMAYVRSYYDTTTFKTNRMECAVNTNSAAYGDMDLTNPNGQANSYAGSNMFLDRVLCHELVHGVMSANISGFNAKLPNYFTEGTAELIAGADDTRKNELLATAGSVSMFQAGLDDNAADTLRWYTTGYIWLRWYIKHTSKKGVDLSFEHPLPDLEIFQYKVSDGVAFEYGRANNRRFDLIGDEAIDFYTRNHIGLNKWDLCTSPEYLNSNYGSTVRVPFDDAVERNDVDYFNLQGFSVTEVSSVIYLSPFLCADPWCPNKYGLGKVSSTSKDTNFFALESIPNHYLLNDSFSNINRLNCLNISVSDFLSPNILSGTVVVLLSENNSIDTFMLKLGYTDTFAGITALDGLASSCTIIFVDCRTFSLSEYDTVTQSAYEDSALISQRDRDITRMISSTNNLAYIDKRTSIHEKYQSLNDFKCKAVYDYRELSNLLSDYVLSSEPYYFFNETFVETISDALVISTTNPIVYDGSRNVCRFVNSSASTTYDNWGNLSYADYLPFKEYKGIGEYTTSNIAFQPGIGQAYRICSVDINQFFNEAYSVISFLVDSPVRNDKTWWVYYAGAEILCASNYSALDVYNGILALKNRVETEMGVSFAYCFMPGSVYSSMLYSFYLELKALIVSKGEIPLGIDEFCLIPTVAMFKNYSQIVNEWYFGGYAGYRPYYDGTLPSGGWDLSTQCDFDHILDVLNNNTDSVWIGTDYFIVRFYPSSLINPNINITDTNINNTKSPCYYTSFTQLPFTDRQDELRAIDGATQAYDGVSADILDVNLHTVYDPLSPSYYQGGGTCKQVFDYVKDSVTGKMMLGLINGHKDGDNVPDVDNNYSYPVYGSGCPWIVYPEKEALSYDSIYFYLTRDNYSGTITYQLTSNKYPSLKPIFQTIVFGSPDTDNYTAKYPLYVGGGANYVTHTEYNYTYQPPTPPGGDPPPSVTVHVEGNKYSLNLTGTKTSNISPIYPSAEADSAVTNFAFRGSDGDWKYLASFDGSISNDDILFAHKLADPYYWGIISPYVGSDVDYSYIYDINNDTTNIYKPVRIINPYREFKEERGFGAISLSNLYAKCSDNKFGIRKVKIKDYVSSSILDKIENDVIYLIDDFDKFDKLDIIFTDGSSQYTTTWHKNSLTRALLNSLDIDFDLTRGIVYNLFWDVDISASAKDIFYGASNNCTIVDVIGYKKKYSRYLVLPNSCVHKEFGMEDATGEISTYSLNNVLCIYLGEG